MIKNILLILFYFTFFTAAIQAQEYLPHFSVDELPNNRYKISWLNPHANCFQLSIQRSADSLKNFKTILSAKNPALDENGFIDYTAPAKGKVYYKIFYALKSGNYYFSEVIGVGKSIPNAAETGNYKNYTVNKNKPVWGEEDADLFLADNTKNASLYVYTEKGNHLVISLPKAKQYHYKLIIYDKSNTILFETGRITETRLIVEKVNFYAAGYYKYELFENGQLIERNRFYIEED